MSSALKFTLKWVGLFLLFLAFMYWFYDLGDYEWGPREPREPTIRDLPLERSDDQLWSPQSAALIEAFSAQKNELETLREMMVARGVQEVWLLGDILLVNTFDGRRFENEEVDDRELWLATMEGLNATGVRIEERFDATVVYPQSPGTTPDRSETVNYLHNHPMPEKECSHEFRHIPCGVCDVSMEDNWSIRFEWSSGEFEREYSENLSKVYGDETSGLTKDEIVSQVEKARKECRQSGLKEIGNNNLQNVRSLDENRTLSVEERSLVGKWPLCVDPDRRVKDSLLFDSDGSGYVLRTNMPDIEFIYRAEGTSLRLLMQAGERAIWIPLKISPDGKKLLMYSDTTKNTSFYVRESDVAEFDCDPE